MEEEKKKEEPLYGVVAVGSGEGSRILPKLIGRTAEDIALVGVVVVEGAVVLAAETANAVGKTAVNIVKAPFSLLGKLF